MRKLLISTYSKKLALAAAALGLALGTFATSGDGKSKNSGKAGKSLLSLKSVSLPGSFSLKTTYSFRGSQVINTQESGYINLNTSVTYQTGHTSYIVPLKKKIFLNNKVVFNPNSATR